VAPILVHLGKTGETFEVSGVGPYPQKATADFYRTRCGGEIPSGVLRTVVPAAPDAWCTALERWGTLSFADAVGPALECAAQGFPLSRFSAAMTRANVERYRGWPTSAALYLHDGQAPAPGHRLVLSELAATITLMIEGEKKARRRGRARAIRAARDVFYKGEIARRIAEFHAREGGLLEARDLAEFQVDVAPALRASFRGYEVAACGFWCQGPVLLQMLNLIEPFDFTSLGHNSPRALHLLVEATKLAFRRPRGPLRRPQARQGARGRAALESVCRCAARPHPRGSRVAEHAGGGGPRRHGRAEERGGDGECARAAGSPGSLDTSYVAVVDAEGNGFSATPSDPNVDSPVVPGVGCVVSPRGSQGWLVPGHPSEVAPGKRPRLTPAPAMAFKDGRLFMPFGTPGGDVQQQAMLQVFLNITAYGMSPQQAVEAPRVATRSFPDSFWPHSDFPGRLDCERGIPAETRAALGDLGHLVEERPDGDWRSGAVCAVVVGDDGTLMAAADPRRGAHAIGW
jgi:gamma-glutamyltranspeptidase/glutathione hydrolase